MQEEFHFFWKDTSPLSQWFKIKFKDKKNISYNCAEQYMMYQKAILFNDIETAEQILKEKHPAQQKQLGRKIKNFDETIWTNNCRKIVFWGNYFKFTQHIKLRKLLLSTIGTIVEASPVDKIWGIGLDETDERIFNRETWQGENRLGEILTDLKNMLQDKSKDILIEMNVHKYN